MSTAHDADSDLPPALRPSLRAPLAIFALGFAVLAMGAWRCWFSGPPIPAAPSENSTAPDGLRRAETTSDKRSAAPPMPRDLSRLNPSLAEQIRTHAQAVRDRPNDPEPQGRLGILYEAHGYRELALQCYANAISGDPSNPRWRFHWAVVAARLGDAAGAEQMLREVIAIVPDHASARERLGLLLLERSAHSEATECFKRVIQLRPNEPQGYVDAARVDNVLVTWTDGTVQTFGPFHADRIVELRRANGQ